MSCPRLCSMLDALEGQRKRFDEDCRTLAGAQGLRRRVLVGSADSLVFGDDLGAEQKQRRRDI